MEITQEGLDKIKQELDTLKNVKRKEITERLRKAISFGDLSENFDYHNAREEQNFLEQRIAQLEDQIRDSIVLSLSPQGDTVQLGSKVSIESNGEKFSFTITDPQLSNPVEDKISSESPLGKALLGKKKGDKIEVMTPQGKQVYALLDIFSSS
ncbi:MAG: transcription elongation factor GreA [Parcubacteria group bacterium Greene0714_21]|nr:MAG: transcription elongation factor GreA [Parcubacteria group bacterium Greene0416_39]TSC97655.1 MAG: transcription elongation factor GreA [Parcubacteria group bacterium Greene1014_47]TSD03885.1 MAG: transcription elongation factor GreA [Parcubacteria group bacterium Greene0714_21]